MGDKNSAAPKRIVIIGCGPGGLTVANGLSKSAAVGKVEVTILEKKDHVDLCIPHPRSMVNSAFAQEVLLTHDRALFFRDRPAVDRTRLVNVKEILAISDGFVKYTTRDGESQEDQADAIVVATGTSYKGLYVKNNDGLFRNDWLKKLAEWRAAAGNAKHILIIGGGVTGVEVAGELATEHPTCKVTLIHGGKHLCNHTAKYHAAVMWGISTLPGSVEVILEDRVEAEEMLRSESPKTFRTEAGKTIADVDMVLLCTGVYPNTSFISIDKLNEKREIVVDNTLQAPALTSANCPVFAIGDVTHCGWGRAMVADKMAKACLVNLENIINNKPLKAVYSVDKQPFLPVMISLGRKQGAASVPWVNNWLARWMKAPDLIASMAWKNLGQKAFVLSEQAKGPTPLATVAPPPVPAAVATTDTEPTPA